MALDDNFETKFIVDSEKANDVLNKHGWAVLSGPNEEGNDTRWWGHGFDVIPSQFDETGEYMPAVDALPAKLVMIVGTKVQIVLIDESIITVGEVDQSKEEISTQLAA
jgi:hypothetical protein